MIGFRLHNRRVETCRASRFAPAGAVLGAAALVCGLSGCGALADLFQPSTVLVRMVNDGDYPVEVTLVRGNNQNAPRAVLEALGDEEHFTIAAGGSRTIRRDCDGVQAVEIEKAELMIVGSIGPEANSNVLRDGDDYNCGDTIEFRFDHTALIVDFDISVAVSS